MYFVLVLSLTFLNLLLGGCFALNTIPLSAYSARLNSSYYSNWRESIQVPTKRLNDGNEIPMMGLGTFKTHGLLTRQTINKAVELGYRHIDTAWLYNNEAEIGLGIKDVIERGLVKREDLFVTTKLDTTQHGRTQVVPALRDALSRLGLNYVDLFLIHTPYPQNGVDYLETWKGMVEAKGFGLTRSIGVSNFNEEEIERLLANTNVRPAVNQIEVNPTMTQNYLVSLCQKHGITVIAHTPFGFLVNRRGLSNPPPPRFDDPVLVNIGQKYGKSTSQVVLRYLLDRGTIPIPKSTNATRLHSNIDVFDFQLTEEEVKIISAFNRDIRACC